MRPPAIRRLLPTALLVASTMLLAGCFTLESSFTISDHGTVDLEVVSLIDTERLTDFADLFGEDIDDFSDMSGPDLLNELSEGEDPCGDMVGSLSNYDVSTREISDGTLVGVGCTVSDVRFEDLTDVGSDSFVMIEQDDSGTRFELILEGTEDLTGGGDDDITELLGLDIDELFVLRFIATAPGSLSDNNATSTDGATATWLLTTDAPFVSDGTATMTASWTPSSSSSSSTVLVIAVIVGVLVVIGLVVLLVRKRSGRKGGDAPEGIPAQPITGPPGGPAGAPAQPTTPQPPPPGAGEPSAPLGPPPAPRPPQSPPSAIPPPPPPAD